jgi:hypothetical protein
MRTEHGRTIVNQVSVLAERERLTFLLRPHPSEKDIEQVKAFRIDNSSLPTLLRSDPVSTLFVGIFSSLLYQAAFKGFRTLWLQNEIRTIPDSFLLLTYLPNAVRVAPGDMVTGTLTSCLIRDRSPVNFDSASVRLAALLKVRFPSIVK